ncbi:hypothetical protein SAMN05421548_114150 [Paraburkholderia lycopersici]|uniref:Uncharacterized protein n=1 Tax=Paraburkholderia lycopersici TaxID=416944 RepID=A0A1G6S475_9BURK|nr:hypothetical protein SAMN05421548_114150 [Paraburkholderia lycopersici]
MPSCKSIDAVRARPWLAHTPQPDEPPPDQPGEPDVPPIGDPPAQPGEVPHSGPRCDRPATSRFRGSRRAGPAVLAAAPERNAVWTRWARWVSWTPGTGETRGVPRC